MNTKLHAVADGRPTRFFMTAGQVSDYTRAAALLGSLPKAEWLLADRDCDADWFRDALKYRGIKPCTPGGTSRGEPVKHDKHRYKRRNRIEQLATRRPVWLNPKPAPLKSETSHESADNYLDKHRAQAAFSASGRRIRWSKAARLARAPSPIAMTICL